MIYFPSWGSNQSLAGSISSLRLEKSSETRTKQNDHDTDSSSALMLWVFPGAGRGPWHRFSSYCLLSRGLKSRQILAWRNLKILQAVCDLFPKESDFESLLCHVGPVPVLQDFHKIAQLQAAQSLLLGLTQPKQGCETSGNASLKESWRGKKKMEK